MSRINIDLWAFSDIRFKALGRSLFGETPHAQDFGRAKMERIWMHCTQCGTNTVSFAEAGELTDIENFASHALDAGLFEAKEGGDFYVCGTKGRIEWLDRLRKQSSKAGKTRAEKAKRNSKGRYQPEPSQPTSHVAGVTSSAPTPALAPTLTPAPVLLNTLPPATRSANVVKVWCDEYKKAYGTSYEILKRDAGILTNFGKGRSEQKIQALFACYLAIKEPLYVSQRHPLSLFFRDLAKINAAAQTGVDPSKPQEADWERELRRKESNAV